MTRTATGTGPAAGPQATSPSPGLATIRLITSREFTQRVRGKVFRISTVLMVAAVVATALILNAVSGHTSTATVGLVPQTASVADALVATGDALDQHVSTQTVPDVATGEARLRSGELDALVVAVGDSVQVVVKKQLDSNLQAALNVLARQVAQNIAVLAEGGNPQEVNAAIAGARVDVRALEKATQYQAERVALGIAAGILVYLALMIYGQSVAQGVVEEKTSRVVELLLATVRPWQLMLGKVAGIGAAGLVQMVLVVGAGVAAGLTTGALSMPSSVAVSTAVWAVIWFVVGFVMYALLFAATGAMVSRQEDVGGVTAPILMLIVVPYVIGISVLPADPTNALAKWLSLIPFFSPTLMPVRIALGAAAPWEIALSLVLSVGLTVALVGVSGRIYANSVMRIGSRVRLGDALRPL